jgi:hypothetical protein
MGVWPRTQDALLLLGGLRGPPKAPSRCAWPLPMRPPGTAMGPLPLGPAIAPLDGWCRRSRELRRETRGLLEVRGEASGGGAWWGVLLATSEFGWLVGAKVVVMSLARFGTAVLDSDSDSDSDSGSNTNTNSNSDTRKRARNLGIVETDITCLDGATLSPTRARLGLFQRRRRVGQSLRVPGRVRQQTSKRCRKVQMRRLWGEQVLHDTPATSISINPSPPANGGSRVMTSLGRPA